MNPPKNPWPASAPHWLYDEIMRHIEPDLMLVRIPLHAKKYASESDEARAMRMEHYEQAFKLYDSLHDHVVGIVSDEAVKVRRLAQEKAITEERAERKEALGKIEGEFRSLSDE